MSAILRRLLSPTLAFSSATRLLALLLGLLLLGGACLPGGVHTRGWEAGAKKQVSEEDRQDLESQRRDLEARRQALRHKKVEKLRQAQTVTRNIVKNQQRLEGARRSLNYKQWQLDATRQNMAILASRLDQTIGETTRLTQDAAIRLRSLYMGEQVSLLQMVLDSRDLAALLDRLYYKQKLVAQDKQLLVHLRQKSELLARQKQELAFEKEKIASTIDQIGRYKVQIAQQIDTDRELRDRYTNDARYYERAERQLLAESAQIEAQLRQLASSSSGPVTGSTGAFMWPVVGTITSGYGYRFHPIHRTRLMHTGLDIAKPSGTPVKAADGGKVIYAGWRGGYGKVVMIDHGHQRGKSIVSLYGHLSSILVGNGQTVSKGQVVARVGSTGFSTGPHLHFEIRENGATVDPRRYL